MVIESHSQRVRGNPTILRLERGDPLLRTRETILEKSTSESRGCRTRLRLLLQCVSGFLPSLYPGLFPPFPNISFLHHARWRTEKGEAKQNVFVRVTSYVKGCASACQHRHKSICPPPSPPHLSVLHVLHGTSLRYCNPVVRLSSFTEAPIRTP